MGMKLTPATLLSPGFLSFLCFGAVILSAAGFAVLRWFLWAGCLEKTVLPRWRGALALTGFVVATFSLLAAVALWFHALFTGGFPFYHPVLLFWLRVGFWAAVIGLTFGIAGKGQLRVPAILCSLVAFGVWLSEAMAQ